MPYVKKADVSRISTDLDKVLMATKGELTFAINRLMMNFVNQHGKMDYSLSSDMMAACHDAADEWARQVHHRYEDHKKRENGDVFQEFIRRQNL